MEENQEEGKKAKKVTMVGVGGTSFTATTVAFLSNLHNVHNATTALAVGGSITAALLYSLGKGSRESYVDLERWFPKSRALSPAVAQPQKMSVWRGFWYRAIGFEPPNTPVDQLYEPPQVAQMPDKLPTADEMPAVEDLRSSLLQESRAEEVAAPFMGERPDYRLDMGEQFQPDAQSPLATGILLVGGQESGKTTAAVRFLEQYVSKFGSPCVVFDSQGDWISIVEDGLCPRGVIATPENLPSMVDVVRYKLQVVIDLSKWEAEGSVGMDYEIAARLMARLIIDLMKAQKAIAPDERIPVFTAIDEIHLWVSQQPPSYLTRATAKLILDVMIALATTGRKLGVVPIMATQRIARVNKDVIGSVETRIFGRADLDNDLARYREYVPESVATDDQIRGFRKGKMIVSMGGKQMMVQFYNRQSRHVSHTPRVSRSLASHAAALPKEALEQLVRALPARDPEGDFVQSLLGSPRENEATTGSYHHHASRTLEDRRAERERRYMVGRPVVRRHPSGHTKLSLEDLPENLRAAYETLEDGMGNRELGEKLGVSKDTARQFCQRLIDLGYLSREKHKLI